MATIAGACATGAADTEPVVADGEEQLVAEGEQLYEATCAQCHGADLGGTDNGPPFLDDVYTPDHHPDGAFYAAAQFGVQAHHWAFGAMPPQDVDEEEVAAIVAYVRSVQRAEGIAP
ncbi:MAG TPA: cytochrome c [Euzebyales bacterium]